MPARPSEPNSAVAVHPAPPFADRILEGYLPALVGFGLAAAAHYVLFSWTARSSAALFFIYLLALLVASWCGRGPGLAVLFLTVLLPYAYRPGYTLAKADREVLVSLAAIWFLVSHVASARRKAEVELRRYNEELDQRVREQTEALRASEGQFRTLADAIPQLCWIAAANGRIIWYNARWYDYTGCPVDDPLHVSWGRLHDPLSRAEVEKQWREATTRGHSFDMTMPLRGADGRFRTFLVRACPVKDAAGAVVRWFGTNTDITERQQIEDELRRSNGALRRANESLAQFAYISAHDLQEPLRTIVAFSQLLMRRASDSLSDEGREHVQLLVHAATRMSEMVSGMMTYSMLSGEVGQKREAVELDALFDELVETMQGAIAGSGADVRRESLPVVEGDRPQLQQVFQNLLSNALKYRREGVVPEVCVRAERSGAEWRIAFRDNGQGFEQKYADRIFGMFQRLHGREVPGSGVGLAVSKAVVERHGGSIWVESELNRGTTFYFTLPVAAGTEVS